ncbi:MAG: DUF58 domain-containing protein [Rubricoccaceae bacterium]
MYLTLRFFWATAGLVLVFVTAFFVPALLRAGQAGVALLAALVLADTLLLWRTRGGALHGTRDVPDPLSLGERNPVRLRVASTYPFSTRVRVIDEVPVAFQHRSDGAEIPLAPHGEATLEYTLRPVTRGAYGFGHLNLFAASPLGLVLRRFRAAAPAEARVYPSLPQMTRYSFLAVSDRLREAGVRRVRRVGQTVEFDQIRAYVPGDDRRTVNWRATARRGLLGASSAGAPGGGLLVNQFQEERAQPVVAALDMGRAMRSPFEGLTLLDHAVNAALALLATALARHDRAGLVAFDRAVRVVVRPERAPGQQRRLLEALYRLAPAYTDPSYEALLVTVLTQLRQRSLVLLFANFDTVEGMRRQLPCLRRVARAHRLVVVLFENTGIRELLVTPPQRLEDVYVRTVAEGLAAQKREIARTLERHGIGALLTRPETLTVDALNRYLQIKASGPF